ncbi:hypothetical protein EM55_023835 [Vibrio parahaemolyticus]|nr:hypothetical protein EM55_023835 [Vibrio parahaemolyticus]
MFSLANLALSKKSHNKQFKQIRNAWQFWFAESFVFMAQMRWLLYYVAHYLIGRYAYFYIMRLI